MGVDDSHRGLDAGAVEGIDRLTFLRRAGVLASVGGVASLVAACGGSATTVSGTASSTGSASASAGTAGRAQMIVAGSDTVASIDPMSAVATYSEPASLIAQVLYDTLVGAQIPPGFAAAKAAFANGGAVYPKLAKSWSSNQAKTVWRFELEPTAISQAGNHLTADDVDFSILRGASNPAEPTAYYLDQIGYKSGKAIDTHTYEMTLSAPSPPYFLAIFSLLPLSIYDATEVRKHATATDKFATAWLAKHAAGFGPYALSSFNQDGGATIELREDYPFTKPAIKKIIQLATPESANRLQLVLNGSADFTDQLSPTQLKQLNDSGKVGDYVTGIYNATAFLAFDNSLAPFQTTAQRRAIAQAIPYETLLKDVYLGKAQQWKTLIEPWFQGATDEYWDYPTDTAAAKASIAKLPAAAKTFPLSYPSGSQLAQQIAVLVADSLNAVGMKVTPTEVPIASFSQKRVAGGMSAWIDTMSGPTPASTLSDMSTTFGSKGFFAAAYKYTHASQVDAFMTKLEAATTASAQNAVIAAAQKLLVSDLPFIPLVYSGTNAGHAADITGASQSEWGSWDYRFFA